MEISAVDDIDSDSISSSPAEAGIDLNEVFTFKHEDGRVVTATVADLGKCAMFAAAGLTAAEMAAMARGLSEGQQLQAENEDEEAKEEAGEQAEKENYSLKAEETSTKETIVARAEKDQFNTDSPSIKADGADKTAEVLTSNKPDISKSRDEDISGSRDRVSDITETLKHETEKKSDTAENAAGPISAELTIRSSEATGQRNGSKVELVPLFVESPKTEKRKKSEVFEPAYLQEHTFPIPEVKSQEEFVQTEAPLYAETADYEQSLLPIEVEEEQGSLLDELTGELFAQEQPESVQDELSQGADITELAMPIDEAEQIITLAAERIEELVEEDALEVQAILEQITEKAEAAYNANYEITDINMEKDTEVSSVQFENDAITKHAKENFIETEEEIEELFTRLLNKLEIDYTPEVLDCLVKLAARDGISDLIMAEDVEQLADQGIGTHEVIKRLLASLNSIKDLVTQAGLIGKSALQLYQLNYA